MAFDDMKISPEPEPVDLEKLSGIPDCWDGLVLSAEEIYKVLSEVMRTGKIADNSPLIKSNLSMRETAYWATFRHSDLYGVCLKRSQEFINGLISRNTPCRTNWVI
jgi:hypothetical protein